jgi:hypothetical protein
VSPAIGATIRPMPQIAIAICCSSGGKVSISMACEDGIIAAEIKESHFGDVDARKSDFGEMAMPNLKWPLAGATTLSEKNARGEGMHVEARHRLGTRSF